jgi:hypothetical protein
MRVQLIICTSLLALSVNLAFFACSPVATTDNTGGGLGTAEESSCAEISKFPRLRIKSLELSAHDRLSIKMVMKVLRMNGSHLRWCHESHL